MQEEYIPRTEQPVEDIQPQVTNEDFFSAMNNEFNRESKFSEEEMSALRETFKVMSDEYPNLNKEQQALYEAKVVTVGDRMFKNEEFRKTLSGDLTDSSLIGDDPVKKFGNELATDLINITNGNNETIYKDNTPGYIMKDGSFMSMEDIQSLVKGKYIDQKSIDVLTAATDEQIKLAGNVQPGENAEFNWSKQYNFVKNNLIGNGDIKSLATDKIFGNRVFEDDLMSAIENGTYQELGLSEEVINSMDPTPDGKISSEDAAAITSGVLQDNDMLKDYLTDYYVKAMEQNFYDSLSPDVRKATQWKNQHNPPIKETSSNNIKVKGGVVKNGIFMPNK